MPNTERILAGRFLWRAFASYGLLILLTVAILGELIAAGVRSEVEADMRRELRATLPLLAGSAREMLDGRDAAETPDFPAAVRRHAEQARLRLTLFDARGRAVADNGAPLTAVPAALGEPLWVAARDAADGVAHARTSLAPHDAAMLVSALRLGPAPAPLGMLRVARPAADVERRLDSVRELVLAALVVSLCAAFGLARARARAIARPLVRMADTARAMAQGDFSGRMPVDERDVFGDLAQALNRLASASRERLDVMDTDRNRVLAILGVMVEGVVAVDTEERVVHMNAAAARILDTQAASASDRRVWEVTRLREVSEILAAAVRTRTEQTKQVRLVVPPRDRWVELHASPLLDSDRRVAGAVVVLHDVSELRRLEAIRRDFVANVSHELKTPITAIRGMVETVLDDPEMDPEFRERFLTRIKEQSGRLGSLVTDLLTLSRLEADGQVVEPAVLDLRQPLRDSAAALAQPAEQRGIAVEVDLPDAPVRVLGDAESLRLVVTNLIDNALKYTPEGGRVWVRLRVTASTAVLSVRDTGIGIESKHLDRIFQRFYRVDKARSRELGGTGLGLSIVKHVVGGHRGDVRVDSQPGRGSSFEVSLPLI